MITFKPYPVMWYAQSSNAFYSEKKIENLATKEVSTAKPDEEFHSDQYLLIKKLNQTGIYRYGISNDINAKEKFLDFYFSDNKEDFHYKTINEDYLYGISITFSYKDKNGKSVVKTFDHFSKYLTITKAQQKVSDFKFTDIFVYKFGHSDVHLGEVQSFTHDGHSVGFKASIQLSEGKSVNICIRGNISFDDPKPNFHIILTTTFDCNCHIELHTDDIDYLGKKFNEKLIKNQQKFIIIERNKNLQDTIIQEDSDLDIEQIKKDYKEVARFVDWNEVPNYLKIDWNNDDIDTIGNKFLKWESHIKCKPEFIIKTKYFDLDDKGLLLYHNKNYYDYIIISIFINDKTYDLCNNSIYTITKDKLFASGQIQSLSYKVGLLGNKDKLPILSLIISTKEKVTFSIKISSPLPFKFNQNSSKTFTLDDETLTLTTID